MDNIQDFANAMAYMKRNNVQTKSYTINSHGSGGNAITEACFSIGMECVNPSTDFSSLKEGLHGHDVFIGACNVGTVYGGGDLLITNMAQQTSSVVIASDHEVAGGYEYDGSYNLNRTFDRTLNHPDIQNQYMISFYGNPFVMVNNVTIEKNSGISWDFNPRNPYYLNLNLRK